jgi:hypothetical protein
MRSKVIGSVVILLALLISARGDGTDRCPDSPRARVSATGECLPEPEKLPLLEKREVVRTVEEPVVQFKLCRLCPWFWCACDEDEIATTD